MTEREVLYALQQYRINTGVQQGYMASRLGVTRNKMQALETGRTKWTPELLSRYCRLVQCPCPPEWVKVLRFKRRKNEPTANALLSRQICLVLDKHDSARLTKLVKYYDQGSQDILRAILRAASDEFDREQEQLAKESY